MVEIGRLPPGQGKGGAHRATPLSGNVRFTPANDNRSPARPMLRWAVLVVAGAAVAAAFALQFNLLH